MEAANCEDRNPSHCGEKLLESTTALKLSNDTPVANGIITNLWKLGNIHHGFPVDQLQHSLQAATLARDAGESPEFIVATLCHDMGKTISAFNHEAVAAEMLKPYVSDSVYNVVRYHGIFQGRFFWKHLSRDVNTYLKFKDRPWFELAMRFSEAYDKPSFKRNGAADSLESFIPLVRQVVGR